MKTRILFPISLLLIILTSSVCAQNSTLLGQVTVFDSIPLNEIQIQVESMDKPVFSDLRGNFRIPNNEEIKLVISGDGFYKQTVKVKSGTEELHINMTIKAGKKNIGRALAYLPIMKPYEVDQLLLAEEANKYAKYKDMEELLRKEFPGKVNANSNLSHKYNVAIIVDDNPLTSFQFYEFDPADIKEIYFTKVNFNSTIKDVRYAIVITTKNAKSNSDVIINGTERYMSRKF